MFVVGATTPTEPLTAHAIGHNPLALLTPDFATRGHIDAYFAEHGITPRIAMETNSIQALIEMVRHTPLATVLPDAITQQRPHLSAVPLDPPFPTGTVTLLTREGAIPDRGQPGIYPPHPRIRPSTPPLRPLTCRV